MLDSLYVGVSGLQGFSKGLRVISNNVTNLNTPGFKGAKQQFGDLFYQTVPGGASQGSMAQYGTGLSAMGTSISYLPGEVRQTGNALDATIDGDGFFVLKTDAGAAYTRAGQFAFDENGVLVSRNGQHQVMGYNAAGGLGELSLNGLRFNPAKPTSEVDLTGILSSVTTEHTINSVKVIDGAGAEHVLKIVFKRASEATPTWGVEVFDGTTSVGSGNIRFADGHPVPGEDSVSFSYSPTGASATNIKLTLGEEATSFASGTTSTLAATSQDGYAAGSLTNVTFDAQGVMSLTYSNGQTGKGPQLAVARFDRIEVLEASGDSLFVSKDAAAARMGRPGEGGRGAIGAGQLELSNVDLSVEFSDLMVMQRGYQAASKIVSTANEMLQELFDMKGRG